MFNMRIDVVRKELERRFKEVEELSDSDDGDQEAGSQKFLYFLQTDPLTKEFLVELSHYDERYFHSEPFYTIIRKLIDDIDSEIAKKPSDNCDGHLELYSYKKYFQDLLNGTGDLNKLNNSIINSPRTGVPTFQLDSNINYYAEYVGASSLYRLLPLYENCPYCFSPGFNFSQFGKEMYRRGGTVDFINDCRNLYHAVDKYLMTSKSKSALIARLKTYCTWFKLEEFQKKGIKEADISKIIEEYIFSLGYYPIVNARAGRSIYDILADSGENLHWDNSILLELKLYVGKKKCTESSIKENIAQALSYLSTVRSQKDDLADAVYLLVFYDGNELLDIDDSIRVPNVQVEFIYVGKNSPSKLKDTKILGRNK